VPTPEPIATEVQVRVHAAGINPVDFKTRDGKLKVVQGYDFPVVMGNELAGTVEGIGEGVTDFKPGDRVFIMLNAANRDPRAYPDPDRVDLGRDGVAHLTFGFGMHICLGFPLARLEGEIAIPAVAQRFRRMEFAGDPEWINSMVFRGMKRMPVRVAR